MEIKTFSESKAFSKLTANKDSKFLNAIRKSSVSAADAKNRIKVYSNVMKRNEAVREQMRMFSGFAEMPILTNQYFNATVSANIRSFAGFLAIERDMDQPEALLGYYDLLGVTDNRNVQPNIGYGDVNNLGIPQEVEGTFAAGVATIAFNEKLIPGSIKVTYTKADNTKVKIMDDANGNFLALPGIVAATGSSINYQTGAVTVALADTSVAVAFLAQAAKDVAGDPITGQANTSLINRFKLERKYYMAKALPSLLIGETDLMTLAGSDKALGDDVVALMGAKLTEVYLRVTNKNLVDVIVKNDISTPYVIDMAGAAAKFLDYGSRLDFFVAELVNVDTELAKQSAVGVHATAYVGGTEVINWFRKLKGRGFEENTDSTFIDDLVGNYNGIPVLRQSTLDPRTGYAICKTKDGQLAPCIRGIFLPLTSTPIVNNYMNPVQSSHGLYYQEAIGSIAAELAQKFTVSDVAAAPAGGVFEVSVAA